MAAEQGAQDSATYTPRGFRTEQNTQQYPLRPKKPKRADRQRRAARATPWCPSDSPQHPPWQPPLTSLSGHFFSAPSPA